MLLPQFVVCHWRFARKGQFGIEPAGGVVLHATNAADKLLMLTALDLYDYSAKRALAPDSMHHQVFIQVRLRACLGFVGGRVWGFRVYSWVD